MKNLHFEIEPRKKKHDTNIQRETDDRSLTLPEI